MKVFITVIISIPMLILISWNSKSGGMETIRQQKGDTIFPKGIKNTNNNFRGEVWVHFLVREDSLNRTEVGNVIFAPGARSNWHLHPAGQILLVTDGKGYYQEKGSPKKILRKGDVIKCPPNVAHWHGASKDSGFIQLAITGREKGPAVWLHEVTEQEYNNAGTIQAQQMATGDQTLDTRQQKIVAIAALTAKGDLEKLRPVLITALDSGLTVNEIKEIMVHLSAYCGFPRSLNGINTFLAVYNERKAKGITGPVGAEPSPISREGNKYEAGKKNLEKLTGRPESGAKTGYAAFVPVIDTLLKEHLFADIFNRGVLSYQDRELTTVSALVSLGGVEAQLQGHLSISLGVGLTAPQLTQMISMVESYIGKKEAEASKAVLNRVIGSR